MKIQIICIGKTDDKYLKEGIELYEKRLKHYVNFNFEIIPDLKNVKNLSRSEQCIKEGESILKHINPQDYVVLLDERGDSLTSLEFAAFFEKLGVQGRSQVVFVIGGPFGFSDAVYKRADKKLSFSKMTFSHQMIRLFFVEQLYRAHTIIKGESYHHE